MSRRSPILPGKSVDDKEIIVDEKHDLADDFERLLNLNNEIPEYFEEGNRRSANRMEEEADRAPRRDFERRGAAGVAAALSDASAWRDGGRLLK